MAKYWVVSNAQSPDSRITNCEYGTCSVEIVVGKTKVQLEIPLIQNTDVLKDEELVLVLSKTASSSSASNKRRKVS